MIQQTKYEAKFYREPTYEKLLPRLPVMSAGNHKWMPTQHSLVRKKGTVSATLPL